MMKLKKIISNRKERMRITRELERKSEFRVAERSDSLYLTHSGVAFMKVPKDSTAEDVVEMLNQARIAAVEFDKL